MAFLFLDNLMVNPQIENGHTDISNEIMEALAKTRIPGEARQVLDFILRKTYGWHKKSDFIPLSQFVIGTGLKKNTICRALKKLKDMNIIVTKKENTTISNYMFNKYYDKWKPLPKKRIVLKKENTVLKKENTVLKKETLKRNSLKETNQKNEKKDIVEFPEFDNQIKITKEEYQKLINKFGKDKAYKKLEGLYYYMGSKGKKYKSHYLTILCWERKDENTQRDNKKLGTKYADAGISKNLEDL